MTTKMDSSKCISQPDENDRLLRGLVELRARQVDSIADSACRYDELQADERLNQRDAFYKWLLSLLRAKPGQKLLDTSCSWGTLLRFAEEADLGVVGLDLSAAAVASTGEQVPSTFTSVADAERLPDADNTFDCITNSGSLERYFQPHRAVCEMARTLRPDGLAPVLLPHTFGLLGNILHVWRWGDVLDDGQPLQRHGTNFPWRNLLEMNGLRVILTPLIPINLASFLVYLCMKEYS